MGFEKEYEKKCPYCELTFLANHLNRVYCSEKCKRRMFRKRKQEKNRANRNEMNVFKKNNDLLKSYIKRNIVKVNESELVEAGFNEDYYVKKFLYNKKLLILYYDVYLESSTDNQYLIHQY